MKQILHSSELCCVKASFWTSFKRPLQFCIARAVANSNQIWLFKLSMQIYSVIMSKNLLKADCRILELRSNKVKEQIALHSPSYMITFFWIWNEMLQNWEWNIRYVMVYGIYIAENCLLVKFVWVEFVQAECKAKNMINN